jgi:hypothetical protein
MDKFLYAVWFRDLSLPEDDQDHEWVAVFVIEARDQQAAKAWGDTLSTWRCNSGGQEKLESSIEPLVDPIPPNVGALPVVREGCDESFSQIGW